MSTCTTTTAPTQHLRNLIELRTIGQATAEDLHTALLELEANMGLTLTEPDERIFEEN